MGVVSGISLEGTGSADNCKGCIYGKSTRAAIPKASDTRAKAILDLVHSDVSGTVDVLSLGGSGYFITCIDDHSNWTNVYPMRAKSGSFAMFQRFHKYAEKQTGSKAKAAQRSHIHIGAGKFSERRAASCYPYRQWG